VPASDGNSFSGLDSLSRSILGIQVGLIVLAMIVTRSSVASIQAKRGLPVGNQVVGWVVLSTQKMAQVTICSY
jgi:phosphatidylinositol glycan class N